MQTSNYDAEFGRAGGAVVNVITKPGGNQYHGTASWQYDTRRDDAITNTESQSPSIRERGYPPYGTEHFFAGTFSGPVKLPLRPRRPVALGRQGPHIFFFAYQNQRQASNTVATVLTPTAAGRATLRSLFPAGANPRVDRLLDLTSGARGANPTLIDIGAARPGVEFGRAVTSFAQSFVEPQLQARIDHKVSETSQLSARYLYADQIAPVGGATLGLPGFTTSQANRFQNFLISETHVFSPSVTNELRLSYNRIALAFPLDPPTDLGLTLPNITIAGVSNVSGATYNIGIQTNLQGRVANNYVIQDTISYLRGAHTFRGGFDLLKQRSRQFAPINERGSLIYNAGGNFTGWLTSLTTSGSGARPTAISAAVLLPGVVPSALLSGSLARKRGAHAHPGRPLRELRQSGQLCDRRPSQACSTSTR